MTLPEETRRRLAAWCADRVRAAGRARHQVAYTVHEDVVTLLDRRPPEFPELGAAWSRRRLAQLRGGDPGPGLWSLYRPVGEDGWERSGSPDDDPIALLARIEA